MIRASLLLVATLTAFVAALTGAETEWQGFISSKQIHQTQQALSEGDTVTTSAWRDLLTRAQEALTHVAEPPAIYDVPGYYGKSRDEHLQMKNRLSADGAASYVCALAAAIGHELTAEQRQRFREHAATIVDN